MTQHNKHKPEHKKQPEQKKGRSCRSQVTKNKTKKEKKNTNISTHLNNIKHNTKETHLN